MNVIVTKQNEKVEVFEGVLEMKYRGVFKELVMVLQGDNGSYEWVIPNPIEFEIQGAK